MIKSTILTFLFILYTMPMFAGEGMWLPFLLQQLNEKEMQSMGMKMTAEDIYSVNKGSLKDAIVQFGGGCTGEIISGTGLLLTNHHCGYGQIQNHSSLENNFVDKGFWAKNQKEELSNPGLTAMFIISMADVTKSILNGINADMSAADKQSLIDKNMEALKKSYAKESYQEILIRSFYKGNQYYLFVTETYKDVRLVGAPPSSIGNFGVDTDNWVWPRHTCDFSMFRIYADKNNKPAEYSPDNVPFKPRHFLPVSMDGIKEGDFTMVFGFPGSTNEYLPSESIRQIVDLSDPAKVAIRTRALDIMHKYMMTSEAVKIKYVTKAAGISNGWKKWQGEMEGLKKTNAIEKKKKYETEYNRLLNANPALKAKYAGVLEELNKNIKLANDYVKIREYSMELLRTNIEILRSYARLDGLVTVFEKNGADEMAKKADVMKTWAPGYFKDYERSIDEEIFASLFTMYKENIDVAYQFNGLNNLNVGTEAYAGKVKNLFDASPLSSQENLNTLLAKKPEEMVNSIKSDPMYVFYREMLDQYNAKVSPNVTKYESLVTSGMEKYMAAQMEVFKDKKFYPDANSTLRVTYGNVKGYEPRDAVKYDFKTYLDGVMEKYIPGNYEFDLPPRLIQLYKDKDFGPYAENGKVPVAFIASNHTTGGNSGSPAIDAYGNLIGLNFDRVWEGTMSDYNYDASICRNIMVDIRYVLFIIDKYAGAKHLVDEMKLVHPSKAEYQNEFTKNKKVPDGMKPPTTKKTPVKASQKTPPDPAVRKYKTPTQLHKN